MKIYYISPSIIPSRSANSIHVINMCEALVQLGNKVELFACSKDLDSQGAQQQISGFYGIHVDGIAIDIYRSSRLKGIELGIAVRSLVRFFIDWINGEAPQAVISRNLYAALLLGVIFRKNIIYETHSPEYGFRKKIQKWLLTSNKIKTVVISNALKKVICDFHGIDGGEIYIFHDAARVGKIRISDQQRHQIRKDLTTSVNDLKRYQKIVGYFGHLYSGRGIEVIQGVAKLNPSYAFVVYGGNEKEIVQYKDNNNLDNLFFMGHVFPNSVHDAMSMMDVLLMPYQESVSVGLKGVDTAKWMSPMKMFEYMSAGVPIISSDLPVLREVLQDGVNCLLVAPDDIKGWSEALTRIIEDELLAEKLGSNAYNQYRSRHTWEKRAEDMLGLFG